MSDCSLTKCDSTVNKVDNNETVFRPRVDILEVDGDLMLVADIPGADDQMTEVSLDKNVLTIKGQVPQPAMDEFSLVHREFRSGRFERAFTLTREIDRNGIQATVKDGVLRVQLPRHADAGLKKITVTSA